MGAVGKARAWVDHVIACFNCGLNGHGDVVILHRYEETRRAKNYEERDGKIMRAQIHYAEQAKMACRVCGEVWLGNVKAR